MVVVVVLVGVVVVVVLLVVVVGVVVAVVVVVGLVVVVLVLVLVVVELVMAVVVLGRPIRLVDKVGSCTEDPQFTITFRAAFPLLILASNWIQTAPLAAAVLWLKTMSTSCTCPFECK